MLLRAPPVVVVKALLCPVSLLTVSGIVATVGALLLLLAWFSLSCGPPEMTLLPSSFRGWVGVANDSCPSRLLRGECWRTKPDSGYGLFLTLPFPEDPFLCFPPVNGFPVFFSLPLLPFCSPPLRLVKRFTHAAKGRRLEDRSAVCMSALSSTRERLETGSSRLPCGLEATSVAMLCVVLRGQSRIMTDSWDVAGRVGGAGMTQLAVSGILAGKSVLAHSSGGR